MTAEGTCLYIVNPDVSCREEAPDGALLFNPDTDQVLVVNPTGLLVWRALERPGRLEEVVAALTEQCANVPPGEVQADVHGFVEVLLAKGFVGIYGGPAA